MRNRRLTVGQLRKLIENIPDDVEIVHPAPDHSYRFAGVSEGTALFSGNYISEDYGQKLTPEGEEFGYRKNVLIVT